MILNDRQIRELALEGMIEPFITQKIRRVPTFNGEGTFRPLISHGSSSYGYDLSLSPADFRIFQHVPGLIVDPKQFNDSCLRPATLISDDDGDYFILPAHTYALGAVGPYLNIPPDITVIFLGKSTYARCGIIVNTTPGEAGWKGHLTLEISNSSGADVRIYANEGICQALFFRGEPCENPYGDGKYQNQLAGVTLARV